MKEGDSSRKYGIPDNTVKEQSSMDSSFKPCGLFL